MFKIVFLIFFIKVSCIKELPPFLIDFKNREKDHLSSAINKLTMEEILYSWWLQEWEHLETEHPDYDYIIIQ